MSETILITGATGNIGGHLVDDLHNAGADVVAGVTTTSKGRAFEERGIPSRVVDYADPPSLTAAFAGVDRLLLLFPLVKPMTEWASNAIAAAKSAKVSFLVRSSGMGAGSDIHFDLGNVHGGIDEMVEDSSIPFTLLRPNSFMQNYVQYYGPMIKSSGAIYLPQGDGAMSLIDVRDVASAAAAVLLDPHAHQGRTYTLTGPDALSNADVARIITEVTGHGITYIAVGDETAQSGMRDMGLPDWNIRMLMSLSRHIRDGRAARITEAVRELTGRRPTTFRKFALENTRAWQRE